MQRDLKKIYAGVFILIALSILGWFLFFEYAVGWLEKRLDKIQTDLREKGYVVSYSKIDMAGNPFSIKATIEKPHIKDPLGLIEWQGQEVKLEMNPWQLYTLTCTFPGDQKVNFPQNTYFPLGELHVEEAKGIVTLTSEGKVERFELTGTRLSSTLGEKPQPVFLKDFSLKVENILRPLDLNFSFQTTLVNLEDILHIARLDHPFTIKLDAKLAGFQSKEFPKSLAEWREGGGVLDVNLFHLSWAPIHIDAKGTLTLDKKMYPLGSFSSQITGYQEAMPFLVQLGWIKEKNVSTILFVLDLFSSAHESGAKKLNVPVTLQNKKLSIGPATIFKLQPLTGF